MSIVKLVNLNQNWILWYRLQLSERWMLEEVSAAWPEGEPHPAPPKVSSSSKPSSAAPSKVANPLQHILQTLFGGKKSFDKAKNSPDSPNSMPEPEAASSTPLLDPIVQQFGQLKEERAKPEVPDDDNRPYDPEEEYKPEAERVYDLEDAYDPADETILEEAMVPVGSEAGAEPKARGMGNELYLTSLSAASSLQEQQKMLETLNQQIEEQTRQVEEQEEALRQQRAAVGVSMACFSVSDALMSPPPKSSSFKPDLFEVPEAGTAQLPGPEPSAPSQMIDQSRDPRQAAVRRLAPSPAQLPRGPAPGEGAVTPADQPLAPLYTPALPATYHSPRLQEAAAPETPGEGPTPLQPTPWGGEEGRAPGEIARAPGEIAQPPRVQEAACAPLMQPPAPGEQGQVTPKVLLPTPVLPSLLGPSYPGDSPAFPSPQRGFGNPGDSFHPGNLQQALGPFPTFQHFPRVQGPSFQPPKPVPLFPRGAPGPRYRFQGQPLPGFSNQPPHPMGNHSPSQQELPSAAPPAPALKPPEPERPSRLPSPDSRDRERDRFRSHPGRQRGGYRGGERSDCRYPSERFRRGAEDRRRDRERDRERSWNRDRDWERSRERDRDKNREREHDRDRHRRRERDRGRDRERERSRDRGKERERRERERREENKEQEKDKNEESKKTETAAAASSKPGS
ncbi:uncharacterized protein LOC144508269 [Mustelus asterias]